MVLEGKKKAVTRATEAEENELLCQQLQHVTVIILHTAKRGNIPKILFHIPVIWIKKGRLAKPRSKLLRKS